MPPVKVSPMVRLYANDEQLATRVDAKGVVRVNHTETARANETAAQGHQRQAAEFKAKIEQLKAAGAPAAEIREVRQQLQQAKSKAVADGFEATYHSALADLNKLIGRE